MPPTTSRELLLRALALIERGWTRGRFKKTRGKRVAYCLTGALDAAAPKDYYALRADASYYLVRAISPFNPGSIIVPEWNDAKGRTKPQVVAALKKAIALAAAAP